MKAKSNKKHYSWKVQVALLLVVGIVSPFGTTAAKEVIT